MSQEARDAAPTLKKIPFSEFGLVLDKLRETMPHSIHSYSFIKTAMNWMVSLEDVNFQLLAPNGDYSDSTIVILLSRYGGHLMTAYSNSEKGCQQLEEALLSSDAIPWNEGIVISCLPSNVVKPIERVMAKRRKTPMRKSIDKVLWMPKDEAAAVTCSVPEGACIEPLKPEFYEQINAVWPHRAANSEHLVADQLRGGFGVGLFDNGKLVSWAMLSFYGGMGLVQTVEGYQRRGYASTVVNHMTCEMGKHELDVHLNIVGSNTASLAFFKNFSFRHLYDSTWFTGWL